MNSKVKLNRNEKNGYYLLCADKLQGKIEKFELHQSEETGFRV